MQTLLNQLVYFGFFQSILLLVVYAISKKRRVQINTHMIFLISILLIGLLGKVLHSLGAWNSDFRLIGLSEFSILLFGPTVFLFTRSVLKRKAYSHTDLVHYIPGLLYSIFIIVYFMLPSNAVISSRIKTGELTRVIYSCIAFGLTVNITYWALSIGNFKHFNTRIKNELSYEIQTRFISNFLLITGICLGTWSIIYAISLFGFDTLERTVRPFIWVLLTLIILFITYYVMLVPQVLQIVPDSLYKKYHHSKLSHSDLDTLKVQLDTLMQEKKPYLNSKLVKAELAELLGISNPELARLLNEQIGMNFYEYVNYFRIKEFVILAKTEQAKQLTFFGLAQEAGFNSKTTFNKSFKKLMGATPSTYFNKNLQ